MQMGSETDHHLKAIISEKYGSSGCNVGDDGGFAPNIPGISEGLDLVIEAIDRTGYNGRIKLAIDVAATDFCIGKKYDLGIKSPNKSGQNFKTGEQNFKTGEEYPLVSIEQPFDKDDWERTKLFTALGKSSWNCDRGHRSSEAGEGYTNWGVIVSHRYGETDDSFIADLVVVLAAGQMKSGVPCRGERLVKYNQVLNFIKLMISM